MAEFPKNEKEFSELIENLEEDISYYLEMILKLLEKYSFYFGKHVPRKMRIDVIDFEPLSNLILYSDNL